MFYDAGLDNSRSGRRPTMSDMSGEMPRFRSSFMEVSKTISLGFHLFIYLFIYLFICLLDLKKYTTLNTKNEIAKVSFGVRG